MLGAMSRALGGWACRRILTMRTYFLSHLIPNSSLHQGHAQAQAHTQTQAQVHAHARLNRPCYAAGRVIYMYCNDNGAVSCIVDTQITWAASSVLCKDGCLSTCLFLACLVAWLQHDDATERVAADIKKLPHACYNGDCTVSGSSSMIEDLMRSYAMNCTAAPGAVLRQFAHTPL